MKAGCHDDAQRIFSRPSWEGGCLCGAVRYRAQGEPRAALHCHCADCRRASGVAFLSWAAFPRDALTWSTGE